MSILLRTSFLNELQTHALSSYPNECCGFIFGKEQGPDRLVTEIRPVKNSKEGDQRRRFEIDPLDYLQAEKYALQEETNLLGIYHSHPDHPAIPSGDDLKQAVSFFSYIIISVGKGEVADTTSWQLHRDQFVREEIIIKKKN